jgi:hypothetical protein
MVVGIEAILFGCLIIKHWHVDVLITLFSKFYAKRPHYVSTTPNFLCFELLISLRIVKPQDLEYTYPVPRMYQSDDQVQKKMKIVMIHDKYTRASSI